MSENAFENLENAVFGLLAAVTATHELLVSSGLIDNDLLARAMEIQQAEFLNRQNPEAAAMLGFVLRPLRDPRRQATRKMATEEPQGNA